jgi:hypothetical protein
MESALEERVSVRNPFLSISPTPILPLISSNASRQPEWCFFFMVVPIASWGRSWGSKRQRSTALSTSDSEFYASEGLRDAIWFKALLDELGIDVGTITMYCNNASARSIIEYPHRRSKHIAVHYFFVRDQQELGTMLRTCLPKHCLREVSIDIAMG